MQIGTTEIDTTPATIDGLRLIADDTRWRLVRALRASDRQVGELVEQTGIPQNLVSYHLGMLRQAGFVRLHRSDADARVSYYGVDLAALGVLYTQLGSALAIPTAGGPAVPAGKMVVFLCRANSARSQIAEGWLRTLSGGRVSVRSAGTQPATLHPLAAQVMAEVGIDIGHQQAKHVATLAQLAPDVVVTVCDIAREECAVWQQAGTHLHWSIADPAAVVKPSEREAAFRTVRDEVRIRAEGLLSLLAQSDHR